jgi:MoaA/NifB/PqqE/SkfB family radical SAM enzyme
VQLRSTLMRENIEELPGLLEWVRKLKADSICFSDLVGNDNADQGWSTDNDGWTFRFSEQTLDSCPELRRRFVTLAEAKAKEYAIPITGGLQITCRDDWRRRHSDISRPSSCFYPLAWLDVYSNGEARFCCYALRHFGHVMDTSIAELWNGSVAQETRELLSQDRVPQACSGASCPYVHGQTAGNESASEVTGYNRQTTIPRR